MGKRSERIKALKGKSCAKNTTDSYDVAWKIWVQFCGVEGIDAENPTSDDMLEFVCYMQDEAPNGKKLGYAPTTIRARLAGIKKRLKVLHPDRLPPTDHPEVKKAVDGAVREAASNGYKKRKMKPILPQDLAAMIRAGRNHHGPDCLYTIRNEAILTVQWSTGARVSEMVGLTRDNVEPIVRDNKFYGYHLTWPKSKAQQNTAMKKMITTKNLGNPAKALRRWLDATHVNGSNKAVPVFHAVNTYNRTLGRHLTDRALQSLTRSYLELAGYDPKGYGTHSFRRGVITALAVEGRTAEYIQSVTKHKSIQTIVDYIEGSGIKTEEVMSCFDDLDLELDTGT
tara:strand:- start:992 stop:2011 length:1020 start_codon:yes stop_codon:yes gene_type:complete